MPARTSRTTWPGSVPSSGSSAPGRPRPCCRRRRPRRRRRTSARRRGDPAAGQEPRGIVPPQRARAGADEDHVARPIESPTAARSRSPRRPRGPRRAEPRSTPRANSGGIVSAPSSLKPADVWTLGSIADPPSIAMSSAWWQNASMCVPECSAITSSADALVCASPSPAHAGGELQDASPARAPATPGPRSGAAARGRRRGRRQRVAQRGHSTGTSSLPCVSGRKAQREDREQEPKTPKATAPPSPMAAARKPMMPGNSAPNARPTL